MFASSQLVIDTYYKQEALEHMEDYDAQAAHLTPFALTDSLVNQYLLGLGEFDFENFKPSKSTEFAWFYFLMATFFTNIMFLNMLIAIMGDTFDRLTEKKDRNSLVQ